MGVRCWVMVVTKEMEQYRSKSVANPFQIPFLNGSMEGGRTKAILDILPPKMLSIHEQHSHILSKLTVTLMGFKPMTFRTGI